MRRGVRLREAYIMRKQVCIYGEEVFYDAEAYLYMPDMPRCSTAFGHH